MYIHSLHLENIKAFETLDLEFARPSAANQYTGINVFVGGNSSGKSTLLKCMAMALSGPTTANQQLISPAGWVRRNTTKGLIELQIHWDKPYDRFRDKGSDPTTDQFAAGLVFESDAPELVPILKAKDYRTPKRTRVRTADRGPWNPDSRGWLLGAYGPLRRLTGSSTEALRNALGRGNLGSCVTLFREDAALSESETWLKQQHARDLEQLSMENTPSPLVEAVKRFLDDQLLPDGFRIARISVDHVYIKTPNGGELPMRDLSDGCRSAFALMLDIIHTMALVYGEHDLFGQNGQGRVVINKPGVILIDEIEAHLHPSWQRLICEWLRTRFPLVQFFITTHSPLIVQAADEGGIYVLPLPNEIATGKSVHRLTAQEQRRITLGRAEKVLLGEAFGLTQTWSLRAEQLKQRWEQLSAQRHAFGALSPQDQLDYDALCKQMEITFDDTFEED